MSAAVKNVESAMRALAVLVSAAGAVLYTDKPAVSGLEYFVLS